MGGQLGVLVSSDILKQAAAHLRKQKSRTPLPWDSARKVRLPNPPVRGAKAAALAVKRSQILPHAELEFSASFRPVGLVATGRFRSVIGVLFPIAPCGLTSL